MSRPPRYIRAWRRRLALQITLLVLASIAFIGVGIAARANTAVEPARIVTPAAEAASATKSGADADPALWLASPTSSDRVAIAAPTRLSAPARPIEQAYSFPPAPDHRLKLTQKVELHLSIGCALLLTLLAFWIGLRRAALYTALHPARPAV